MVAALVAWRLPYGRRGALRTGLPVALVVLVALAIPFAVSGRWGLLGVGFNNDLGLHLAWAEWLRSGFGPAPDAGYPLGPHGLAVATAAVPGIGLGQAFVGEIVAIGVLTGLTALGALREMRPGAAAARGGDGRPPLPRRLLLRPGRLQGDRRGALRARLRDLPLRPRRAGATAPTSPDCGLGASAPRWLRRRCPPALAGGIFFSYSFAGLAWPIAILALWSLTQPAVRRALRPRSLLRFLLRPATLLTIVVLGGLAVVATVVGPFGFASSFNKVAGSNTYGPVSPVEALGVWPTSNYRLDAVGGVHLAGLAGAIAVLALLVGWSGGCGAAS